MDAYDQAVEEIYHMFSSARRDEIRAVLEKHIGRAPREFYIARTREGAGVIGSAHTSNDGAFQVEGVKEVIRVREVL